MSGKNPRRHGSGYVRQTEVAAGVAVCELQMVESQHMQDGGVQVVDVHTVLDSVVAEFVGCAVDESGLHTGTSHPDGVTVRVVIAAVGALRPRSAAEFAAPDDEGFLQQSARLEVFQ